MQNQHRLLDRKGSLVRRQEKHVGFLLDLIHQYCPPGEKALDPCAGSGSFLLACMYLGIPAVISDIDEECMDLAEARGRQYLDHLVDTSGTYSTNTRAHTKYDRSDLYKWMARGDKNRNLANHVLVLQPETRPYAMPHPETSREDFDAVMATYGLLLRGISESADHYTEVCAIRNFQTDEEIKGAIWGTHLERLSSKQSGSMILQVSYLPPSLILIYNNIL